MSMSRRPMHDRRGTGCSALRVGAGLPERLMLCGVPRARSHDELLSVQSGLPTSMTCAHRHALAPLLLALTAALPAQKPNKPPKPATAVVAGEVGKKLDEVVLAFDAADGGFCGVVLVAAKGEVLLDKGYGVADAAAKKPMPSDALFDWASVSKQFTAAAMLRLIEASWLKDAELAKLKPKGLGASLKKWRKLGLDDPLTRFFPDVAKDKAKDKAKVTLRQLLNHTSGIESGFKSSWTFDASDRESFVKMALALPMTAKPGEAWEYSNSAYALVAAIIERVSVHWSKA